MVEYKLSEDDYLDFRIPQKSKKRWYRMILLITSGILLVVLAFYYKQYLFILLLLAISIFIYIAIGKFGPKIESESFSNNPFRSGNIKVNFTPSLYDVSVNNNKLHLSPDDLVHVHDINQYYRLDHISHVSLLIPKQSLSEEEIEIIKQYKKLHPGYPENQEIQHY